MKTKFTKVLGLVAMGVGGLAGLGGLAWGGKKLWDKFHGGKATATVTTTATTTGGTVPTGTAPGNAIQKRFTTTELLLRQQGNKAKTALEISRSNILDAIAGERNKTVADKVDEGRAAAQNVGEKVVSVVADAGDQAKDIFEKVADDFPSWSR
jgi:hypothetical protein